MRRIGLYFWVSLNLCSILMGQGSSLELAYKKDITNLDTEKQNALFNTSYNLQDSSRRNTKQSLDLKTTIHSDIGGFDAQIEQILQNISDGKWEQAKQQLEKVRTDSAQKGNKQKLGQVELIDAYLYELAGDYIAAFTAYNRAIALYKRASNQNGLLQTYANKGNLLYKLSRFSEAEKEYKTALNLAENLGDIKMVEDLNNNLSLVLSENGDYYEAIKSLEKELLDHAKPSNRTDSTSKSLTLNNIGTIYKKLEDFEQGDNYFREALTLLGGTGVSKHRCVVYENLGDVQLGLGDSKQAATYFKLALKTARKLNDPYEIGYALIKAGEVALVLEANESAQTYYEDALRIFRELDLKLEISNAELGLAKVYEKRDELTMALDFAQKVQSWVEANRPRVDLELEVSKTLSSIYEEQGNFEQAHKFFKRYADLNAQKQQPDILRQVFSYQMEEEYQRKEHEAKIKSESAAVYHRNTLILACAAIGFILLILRERYRTIAEKNKQITLQSEELKELNDTKDKLFAIIGHDLRGPIGGLEMVLDLLISDDLNREEFVGMAKSLKQNTTSIHQMLENLLQWANAQMNGQLDAQPTLVNVRTQIAEVTDFLQTLAHEKQIQIENNTPSDINVQADPHHMNLILRNLIGNAIKFTKNEGQIIIDGTEGTNQATISVEDTGIGMTDKQLHKLFNKTEASSTWGTAGEKGVGLGLTLCKEMVEKNGGKIWAESKPGKGSTFRFSLPTDENEES